MSVRAVKDAEPTKTLMLSFDGDEYPFVYGRCTARILRDVRRVTGMTVPKALELFGSEPDIDVIVTLYMAAAMQSGVTPDFDSLLDAVSYENPVQIRLVDGVPDPEALGGS